MNAAITCLETYLETLKTNEPINRQEGNIEQAVLEAECAAEVRQALKVLRAEAAKGKLGVDKSAGI